MNILGFDVIYTVDDDEYGLYRKNAI
jgi:hypothetical protein